MPSTRPVLIPPRPLAKPWGGSRLASLAGVPAGGGIGEVWFPAQEGGPAVLLKWIDAAEDLSVQVHPDDALARELHGPQARGKSELWVVLEAAPGARLYSGFKPGTSREAFEAALDGAGDPLALLNALPVAPGDAVDIPAGRVHAIGAGCLLAEIQQDSDHTYRVWDHGRLVDGKPRELHRDWARRALRFDALGCAGGRLKPAAEPGPWGLLERLLDGPHFAVERLRLDGPLTLAAEPAPRLLLALEGTLRLVWGAEEGMMVPAGAAVRLPAGLAVRLEAPGAVLLQIRERP